MSKRQPCMTLRRIPKRAVDAGLSRLDIRAAIVAIADLRFWASVEPEFGLGACWRWTGGQAGGGYGVFTLGRIGRIGRTVQAHRYAYEQHVGPIAAGLDLDHLCRNRLCVNPAHLEPVTRRENLLRGIGPCATNNGKTHCKHGHEFTPKNTRIEKATGRRKCRTCHRLYMRGVYQRLREERLAS